MRQKDIVELDNERTLFLEIDGRVAEWNVL